MYGNKFVITAEKSNKKISIEFNSLTKAQRNFGRLLNRENYDIVNLYLINDFYKNIGDYIIKSNHTIYYTFDGKSEVM